MLAGMVEVDDLNGAWKMFVGNVPDPRRAISHDNDPSSALQAPAHRFSVDARTKLLGRFDRSHVGGGLFIALRSALIIHAGLGEDASEFSFACFRPAGDLRTAAMEIFSKGGELSDGDFYAQEYEISGLDRILAIQARGASMLFAA